MPKKLLAILCLAAAPAFAGGTRALLYPLQADGVAEPLVNDAQNLILSALIRMRGGLTPGSEEPLRPSCGKAKGATVACLSKLAGDGVVLRGALSQAGAGYQLVLTAIDAQQRQVGPVTAQLDALLENPAPVTVALQTLGEGFAPKVAPAAPPLSTRLESQPARAVPLAATGSEVSGLERAGKWTAAGGLVLLAGGAAVSILDKRLNDQLNDKYTQHTLTAADASSFQRVHTYNVLATALFIGGAVAGATGLFMWAAAPDEDDLRQGRLRGRF